MSLDLTFAKKVAAEAAEKGRSVKEITDELDRRVYGLPENIRVELATEAVTACTPSQVQTAVGVAPEPEILPDEIAEMFGEPVADSMALLSTPKVVDLLPLVPQVLKQFSNWVTYKSKTEKAPIISGTTRFADSSDPSTQVNYQTLCENIAKGLGYPLPGFVCDGERTNYYTGVDIDGCKTDTGITEKAQQVIDLVGPSYTEWTPNSGLRIWVQGNFGENVKFLMDAALGFGGKAQKVEVFGDGLYFTVTGNRTAWSAPNVATLSAEQVSKILEALRAMEIKKPATDKPKSDNPPDPQFKALFDQVGWKPLEDRMAKMSDTRFNELTMESGKLIYCPMPGHQPRSADMPYTTIFGVVPDYDGAVCHCFGCDWSGDMVKTVREFDGGEDGGRKTYASMYECARAICVEQGLNPDEYFPKPVSTDIALSEPKAAVAAEPATAPASRYAMTPEEIELELDKKYPVIPLVDQAGPLWEDDVMYGILGEIVRKGCEYCEAHPAGVYVDLLVSIGNIIGRGPYFNVNKTKHYTVEYMARVGDTADSRKGTGRDIADEVLKYVDIGWYTQRVRSGFGSAEAIVNEVRDPMQQTIKNNKKGGGEFKTITVPGVDDKRMCIREGELASVFQLAGKRESRADIVIRDMWDGKPLQNIVKGKTKDGISNSAICQEPHGSISGDTTRHELISKLPDGAADNGFGNRFLYTFVYAVKVCPCGGPEIDWTKEIEWLLKAVEFARQQRYMPLSANAETMWKRMYFKLRDPANQLPGLAGKMTARQAAHIRRIAMILALLDMSQVVDSRHLQAAKRLWDYCEDSARYIFSGTTKEQDRIRHFIQSNGRVTVSQIVQNLYHKNRTVAWVQAQADGLVAIDSSSPKCGIRKDGEAYWMQVD